MNSNCNWENESNVSLITSCKQAARLVSISMERKLTFREFLTMSIHLSMCKTCSFYKRQIQALRKIFVSHEELLENTPPTADECLSSLARTRIKESISKSK